MANITIDGREYDTEKMSPDARNQLASLRFAEQEIGRLQAQLAIAQTARAAYAQALSRALQNYGFVAETAN